MTGYQALTQDSGVRIDQGAGLFEAIGREATACLNRVVTGDLSMLSPGEGRSTLMLREDGSIAARVVLHRFSDRLLIRTNPAARKLVWDSLLAHKRGEVRLRDISDDTTRLEVVGPGAVQRLASWIIPLPQLPGTIIPASVGPLQLLVFRAETGAVDGFDLYTRARDAGLLLTAVQSAEVLHVSDETAWEVLRLEHGVSRVGIEIAADDTPVEAGLLALVAEGKGAPFPGEMAVSARRRNGPIRHLIGLLIEGEQLPVPGTPILSQGREAGRLRSVALSPRFGVIGIGAVSAGVSLPGEQLTLAGEAGPTSARITPLPFETGVPG